VVRPCIIWATCTICSQPILAAPLIDLANVGTAACTGWAFSPAEYPMSGGSLQSLASQVASSDQHDALLPRR